MSSSSSGTPVTSTRVVTLAEIKLQLRLDSDDTSEDDLLNMYIDAATEKFEKETRRSLLTKTYTYTLDNFPDTTYNNPYAEIELPYSPATAITSIYYKDYDGTSTLYSSSYYTLNTGTEPSTVSPATSWPTVGDYSGAVTITYTAGYGPSATNISDLAKHAIILLVGHWYENREASTGLRLNEVPMGYDALVTNYKRWEA